MRRVDVATQAELDALPAGSVAVVRSGYWRATGSATVEAFDSATVWAFGSATVWAFGSATVEASGSATVWAFGSATVRATGSATVEASGSATVEAFGSATVRATGSATVRATGSATVRATLRVAIHRFPAHRGTIVGGVVIDALDPRECSPADWLEDKGITITDGTAVLFKAVHDDWQTDRKGRQWVYEPGGEVVAEDYNDARECGGGLHLCATPWQSRRYLPDATRFVAVEVSVDDVVPIDADKVKVRSCRVLREVSIDGEVLS